MYSFKSILPASLLLLSGLAGVAQEKEFTLNDAIIGPYTTFRPDGLSGLTWQDNNHVAFIEDNAIMSRSLDTKTSESLVTLDELNEALSSEEPDALKRLPRFTFLTAELMHFMSGKYLVAYNVKTKAIESTMLTDFGGDLHVDATGTKGYYVSGNDVSGFKDGTAFQITTNEEGIISGSAIHRYEFGISNGLFPSDDYERLAFYEKDESHVITFPLFELSGTPGGIRETVYPMAGQPSEHGTVGIFSMKTKEVVYIEKQGGNEDYVTNVAWNKSGTKLFVAELNRDQNHLKMNQFNGETGAFEGTLFEETHSKYIQPLNPPVFLKNGSFFWISERSGVAEIYHYDKSGKLIHRLNTAENSAPGPIKVVHLDGVNENDKSLVFTGIEINGIEQHAYSMRYDKPGSKGTGLGLQNQTVCEKSKDGLFPLKQLTSEAGYHNITMNGSSDIMIDRYSGVNTPGNIDLVDAKTGDAENLISSPDKMRDYPIGATEHRMFTAEDGTILHGRVIKPHDFDASKTYPVVLYVYNGPNAQLVQNRYKLAASYWMYVLANKGYIVLTVDGRGSENHGLAFEQVTFRQLGTIEMQDQVSALNEFLAEPYSDSDRVGVHGWSYGGFMTISLLENYPDVFSVGVAGGPVTDWSLYEVMYTERYMDTPETNKDGYEKAQVLDKVSNIQAPLLVIHGQVDDVVVPQHSFELLKQSVDNNVQIDFFMYPGHPHNVRGKDRIHLYEKVIDYLDSELSK